MEQYIPKSALVAEIKKRLDEYSNSILRHYDACTEARASELSKILVILNTFEVEEVDLEKELIEWHKEHFKKDGTFIGMSGFYLTNNSQMNIAKHFFELGLKAKDK